MHLRLLPTMWCCRRRGGWARHRARARTKRHHNRWPHWRRACHPRQCRRLQKRIVRASGCRSLGFTHSLLTLRICFSKQGFLFHVSLHGVAQHGCKRVHALWTQHALAHAPKSSSMGAPSIICDQAPQKLKAVTWHKSMLQSWQQSCLNSHGVLNHHNILLAHVHNCTCLAGGSLHKSYADGQRWRAAPCTRTRNMKHEQRKRTNVGLRSFIRTAPPWKPCTNACWQRRPVLWQVTRLSFCKATCVVVLHGCSEWLQNLTLAPKRQQRTDKRAKKENSFQESA